LKKITESVLRTLTTVEQRAKAGILDFLLFLKKVQKFYCEPLNKTGLCTSNCNLCQSSFSRVLSRIDPKRARDVYGVLVFNLRLERDCLVLENEMEGWE
jgi:hypothetical protein